MVYSLVNLDGGRADRERYQASLTAFLGVGGKAEVMVHIAVVQL